MKSGEYLVYEYWLICVKGDNSYDYRILANNAAWALTMVNDSNWDEVILRKISSKPVAVAKFGARNVSKETPDVYLHYHCTPILTKSSNEKKEG